jgi:hypothetical protein
MIHWHLFRNSNWGDFSSWLWSMMRDFLSIVQVFCVDGTTSAGLRARCMCMYSYSYIELFTITDNGRSANFSFFLTNNCRKTEHIRLYNTINKQPRRILTMRFIKAPTLTGQNGGFYECGHHYSLAKKHKVALAQPPKCENASLNKPSRMYRSGTITFSIGMKPQIGDSFVLHEVLHLHRAEPLKGSLMQVSQLSTPWPHSKSSWAQPISSPIQLGSIGSIGNNFLRIHCVPRSWTEISILQLGFWGKMWDDAAYKVIFFLDQQFLGMFTQLLLHCEKHLPETMSKILSRIEWI